MHRGGARLEDMETTLIPLVLALGALTAWSAKAVTVGLDDGADSGTATALMVIGLAFALAAGVAVALALSRGRPGRHRFAAVVVGLVAGPAIALRSSSTAWVQPPASPPGDSPACANCSAM